MPTGRFSINLNNFLRKLLTSGLIADSNGRAVAFFIRDSTKPVVLLAGGKSRPCTGAEGQTPDEIRVAFGCLPKKLSNDPFFFFFVSLSRFSQVSRQIFFP